MPYMKAPQHYYYIYSIALPLQCRGAPALRSAGLGFYIVAGRAVDDAARIENPFRQSIFKLLAVFELAIEAIDRQRIPVEGFLWLQVEAVQVYRRENDRWRTTD